MANIHVNAEIDGVVGGTYQVDVVLYRGGTDILHSRTPVTITADPAVPLTINTTVGVE